MTPQPSTAPAPGAASSAVSKAIALRYPESGAARYGISAEQFLDLVSAVLQQYASNEPEQLELASKLRVDELALARACSAGNNTAWDLFLTRFRATLYEAASRIAKDEATGRELADELYADLYGVPNASGRRVSKLDYYMGRGSLEGWLRTVLSQHFIDRCRLLAKNVSLDEQLESGVSFPAPPEPGQQQPDPRLAAAIDQSLEELAPEERFILASYYLDQSTLATLARQLHVHESTMSRRLDRITAALRKRIQKHLRSAGLSARQCDEILQDLDVRDLDLNLSAKLRQETSPAAFYNKDGSAT